MTQASELEQYRALMASFLNAKIGAEEFEPRYLALFKKHSEFSSDANFEVLNQVFMDVDAFCPDPELRSEWDLSEEQLLSSVRSAFNQLSG